MEIKYLIKYQILATILLVAFVCSSIRKQQLVASLAFKATELHISSMENQHKLHN